jgi:hypothetical protein
MNIKPFLVICIRKPFKCVNPQILENYVAGEWPIRVCLFTCNDDVARYLVQTKREESANHAEGCAGFYTSREFLPRKHRHYRGEIGLSATALDPGLIAHESLHAVCDHYGLMHRCFLEEMHARAVQSLTSILWRRVGHYAGRVAPKQRPASSLRASP